MNDEIIKRIYEAGVKDFDDVRRGIRDYLHPEIGDIFYVSPAGSDSTGTGKKTKPFQTIDYTVGQCTPSNNDVVIPLPGAFDEDAATVGVLVDVPGITIMGAGQQNQQIVTVENSNAGATSVFNITVPNVSISNLCVNEATNTVNGMSVSGGYCHFAHLKFTGAMSQAIVINSGYPGNIIEYCDIYQTTNGIAIASANNTVRYCTLDNIATYAISIHAITSNTNKIHDNSINGRTGTTDYGIYLGNCNHNIIYDNHVFGCVTNYRLPSSAYINYIRIPDNNLLTNFTTKSAGVVAYVGTTWTSIYASGILNKATKITGIVITNSAVPTTPIYRIVSPTGGSKVFPYNSDNPVNSGVLDAFSITVELPIGSSYSIEVNCAVAAGNATLTELDVIELGG